MQQRAQKHHIPAGHGSRDETAAEYHGEEGISKSHNVQQGAE
jgi:hypothetical protein